jgi:hypothetical protein
VVKVNRTVRAAAVVGLVAVAVSAGVFAATTGTQPRTSGAPSTPSTPSEQPTASSVQPAQPGTGPAVPGCVAEFCVDDLPDTIDLASVSGQLQALQESVRAASPEQAEQCHSVAHEIGRRAGIGGADVVDLLAVDDRACLYGYQHGVLEGWSARADLDDLRDGMAAACAVYPPGYPQGSCAHGVGHAIALQGPGTVRQAVQLCDPLGQGLRGGCAGGVFMAYAAAEASQGEFSPKSPLELDADEVDRLCGTLDPDYEAECWGKLWLLGQRVGFGIEDVARRCETAGKHLDGCFKGVGTAVWYESGFDPDDAVAACSTMTDAAACRRGVAWSSANSWLGQGERADTYPSMCGLVPEPERTACTAAEREALEGAGTGPASR